MNILEEEIPAKVIAKTCGCSEKRGVTYAFVDAYHPLCLDKKDVLRAELDACEKLLKYAKDEVDRRVIEKEIADFKMILDLLS